MQSEAAKAAGLPVDKVIVNNHLLGGGFGRRLEPDMVVAAVRIAKQVDGPVKVVWTREEDIQHDIYRPVYRDTIAASLSDGKIVGWKYKVTGSAIMARWLPPAFQKGIDIDAVDSAVDMPYDIPNFHVEYVRAEPPAVPTGFWRGVGPNNNVFAIECFMDELARKAGKDPIDFRRGMLGKKPRLLAALDLVAEKSNWGQPLPRARRARRLRAAVFRAASSPPSWKRKSTSRARCACAASPRRSIPASPSIPIPIVAQLEGGLIFGLTAALYGEITIDKGRVQQSNFHDYRMLRIDQVPKIEVHVIKSGEAPGGIGETGATAGPPALRNAIYRRDRRRLAAAADRPLPDRRGEESHELRPRVAFSSASSRSWWSRSRVGDFGSSAGPVRMAFAGRPEGGARGLSRRRSHRRPGGARARRASWSAANIWRGRRIAWSATPRRAARNMPAASAFKLPFGTLYSTNITPDKETGIGNYSDQDFLDAVHRGIRRDGARLYPAMPFTSYTYMTDADALAIKAYLFSLPPVRAAIAAEYADVSVQPALGDDLLVGAVQSGHALRAGHLEEPGMEQGRLSRRGAGALRRMPYAAKPGVRAGQPQEIRRRA